MASISVVVPCFNEADGVDYLKTKLEPVLARISARHSVELIFVDDGSTDGTAMRLQATFADRPATSIVRHETNQNVGAAIRTGAAHSTGDWIANLDSDCTYEPSVIEVMIAEMEAGADFVTVSPYHPDGRVVGVPAHRLILSKGASTLYRLLVGSNVYTLTAMVRMYRRDVYEKISSPASGFVALPEMMLRAIKQGMRVKEIPAELTARKFGRSKLKITKTIAAHLVLMGRLLFAPRSFYK